MGNDTHSIVAAIQFVNPSKGNFNVADDSEAITKGGFRNFSMNDFGVLSPQLKQMAKIPLMPIPLVADNTVDGQTMTWKGTTLKNLDTLGERSATGMDVERGVYVISVDALGSSVRDFIATNDVILGINGSPVNNLEQMKEALKHASANEKLEITIFRSQQEHKVVIPL